LSWRRAVSKKEAVDPVKASPGLPLDPAEFIPRFAAAAVRAGFKIETFGEIHGHPLVAATRSAPGAQPRVYLSTGMHGDEPAPPWALLRLLEAGVFDDRFTWFLCPLLNPTGFVGRARGNFAQIDLNRDYKSLQTAEVRTHAAWLQNQGRFDLVICGHEDWEAQGFYLYELNLENHASLAPAMLAAARAHGPIESATVIDGRESAEPGVIRPASDPLLRDTWPEALYLAYNHSALNYTIETASMQPIEQRITTQCAVLEAALAAFLR
jgi:protein MpaA